MILRARRRNGVKKKGELHVFRPPHCCHHFIVCGVSGSSHARTRRRLLPSGTIAQGNGPGLVRGWRGGGRSVRTLFQSRRDHRTSGRAIIDRCDRAIPYRTAIRPGQRPHRAGPVRRKRSGNGQFGRQSVS